MVLSAADGLGTALGTAPDADGGDGDARETSLGADGADGGTDEAAKPVGLLAASGEELVTWNSRYVA